jgi:hypothetical protein
VNNFSRLSFSSRCVTAANRICQFLDVVNIPCGYSFLVESYLVHGFC